MIERITEISQGKFFDKEYDAGCSVDHIEDTVSAGEKKVGDFFVIRNDGELIKGIVYSSDHRVSVVNNTFAGTSCRIEYEINACGMRNGDIIDGKFTIVNNVGEWIIPYHISVIYVSQSMIDSISSLESFGEFAKKDWEAALKLCESKEFSALPFMEDTRLIALYNALRPTAGRNNFLEEFLIGAGVKEPVSVSITDAQKPYIRSEIKTSDYINIKKDTWGYVALSVSTDADFIILTRNTISTEDFEDDICTIEYKIDAGMMHNGKNFGRIIVESTRQRFVINVSIEAKGSERDKRSAKYNRCRVNCMKHYMAYYTDTKDSLSHLEDLRNELYEIIPLEENNIRSILAIAWISIEKGDFEDAARVLNRVRNSIIEGGVRITPDYCIYYYLCYKLKRGTENIETLLKNLHKCYNETNDLIVFSLLLKVDPELNAVPEKKLEAIREKFIMGCHAQWLYAEACYAYATNPELLKELGSFELNALRFGANSGIITAELAEHIAGFASSMRECPALYFKILTRLYDTHGSQAVLLGICNVLLKRDERDSEYFKWYALGVWHGLKLTKLYEHYIYSMPENFDEPIPRAVLLYFANTNSLDTPSRVRMYKNILRFYREDEQIENCYAGKISSFTVEQLIKGYVDEEIDDLYNTVIYEELVDRRLAEALPKMLYAACITCPNKKIRKIALFYEELVSEQMLVPWNGKAYAVLLTDNFVAVGIDADGHRYADLDIRVQPVFADKSLVKACKHYEPKQELIMLHECIEKYYKSIDGDMKLYNMLDMLQNGSIRPEFKADIVNRLMGFFSERKDRVPEAVLGIDKELVGFNDRQGFIELLAEHEKFAKAYSLMEVYGFDGVSDIGLMNTASRMIADLRFAKNDTLLAISRECFMRGCFNQRILEYLMANYNGDSITMMEMLKAAVECDYRRFDFAERVFSQLLFTGSYGYLDSVFEIYFGENLKDETLVLAYLAIRSRDMFIYDKEVPELVFDIAEQFIRAGRKPADIIVLALCRYYSMQESLSEEQIKLCDKFIYSFVRRGIIFKFFQDLERFIKLPDGLGNKCIIEYRSTKDNLVLLKMRILPDEVNWHEEMLVHVFEGYFVKVATLLRGEVLEYEIYDEGSVVVSGEIALDEKLAGIDGVGRNVMINRLVHSQENGDLGQLGLNVQAYALLDDITDDIFTLR